MKTTQYQPKTGQACSCRPGAARDNCPHCEGTGMRVDFKAIRERKPLQIRAEYMASLPKYGTPESMAAHRAYYAQFVTPYVKSLVVSRIGIERLKASKDPHLNDIPMALWDSFWLSHTPSMHIRPPLAIGALLKETGEGNSASTGVCILKEAARQAVEEAAQ